MIYRDGKFTVAKTIGPNVNVNGIVGELNSGAMGLQVDPAVIDEAVMAAAMSRLQAAKLQETGLQDIKQKESDTGDGTGEEQQA